VSATYTYGEAVSGTATVTLWQPQTSGYYHDDAVGVSSDSSSSDLSGEYELLVSATVELSGAPAPFSLVIPSTVRYWGGPLILEAAVAAAATGETQDATVSLPASSAALSVTIEGAERYIPGRSYEVRVEASLPDGTLADGVSFEVTGTLNDWNYNSKERERTHIDFPVFSLCTDHQFRDLAYIRG
jgi:hypothetical protein